MTTVNEKDECIEIKEFLTFDGTVKPIYEEFLDEARDDDTYETDGIKKFKEYQLTHEDKVEILERLKEHYEDEADYFDDATIFDRDIIVGALESWITDTFYISIEIPY